MTRPPPPIVEQAYDDLQATIGIIMPEYTKCMTEVGDPLDCN